jgi:hypothetical protein
MNSRPVFSRYLWFLFLFVVVSSFILPQRYGIPYPQNLGPQFTPNVRREPIDAISANKPDIVLVGDSVLYLGVDPDALSNQLGMKTYSIGVPGSGSAVWFLLLKNVILDSSRHPKVVVILFRDTMLTVPDYRTTGRYFGLVDDYAGRNEPLVEQLAYINQMSPLEKLAEQYLPLYAARWEIRERLDSRIRYTVPSVLLNCPIDCVDGATNSVFGRERVDVVALNQAIEDAGSLLYSPEAMDFNRQINRSFLPAMIQLAQENGIKLIFVRTRTLIYPKYAVEPLALRNYIISLGQYLSGQKNVYFLDFAYDVRIKDLYFFDSLHFNAEGNRAFTKILADELKPLLK